jgi:hypothetical protein
LTPIERGFHACAHRRRAILVALVIESRRADRCGENSSAMLSRAPTKERRYSATTKEVERLMRLFNANIEALCEAAGNGQ